MQGAEHVAIQIQRRMAGEETEAFRYKNPGIMATIGRSAAVVQFGDGTKMSGFIAWIAWLFVHLMKIVGFRNRLAVFVDWAWNYFTYDRSARMILEVKEDTADRPVEVAETKVPVG